MEGVTKPSGLHGEPQTSSPEPVGQLVISASYGVPVRPLEVIHGNAAPDLPHTFTLFASLLRFFHRSFQNVLRSDQRP